MHNRTENTMKVQESIVEQAISLAEEMVGYYADANAEAILDTRNGNKNLHINVWNYEQEKILGLNIELDNKDCSILVTKLEREYKESKKSQYKFRIFVL